MYGLCGEATAWQRPINGRFLTPADHNDGSVMSMFMETQQNKKLEENAMLGELDHLDIT